MIKYDDMQELKKIDVLSLAKISSIIFAVMGFILAVLNFLLFSFMMPQQSLSLWEIPLAIVIYGVIGFIFGALFAFIYNFAAPRIGGVEVELSE